MDNSLPPLPQRSSDQGPGAGPDSDGAALDTSQLRADLDLLRAMLDSALDAVILIDQNEVVLAWNHCAEVMLGYGREQVLGRQLVDLIVPPVHRQAHRNGVQRFLRSGVPSIIGKRVEVPAMRADGSQIPVELTLSAIQQNGMYFFSAYLRDISEQKKNELDLRKLWMAVEQSSNSIVIADLNADIEYVNQRFTEVTGYTAAEVMGRNPRMLQSKRTPRALYDEMWAHLSSGRSWSGELVNQTKDGREIVEMTRITPLRDEAGKIMHYVAIKDDVTAQRQVADELAQYRAHLEDLVDSRTEALTQASQALRQTLDEQAAIFDTASSGMALVKEQTLVRCNRQLQDMMDLPAGDLVGQSTDLLFSSTAARQSFEQDVAAKLWQGQTCAREQQVQRRDGSRFWARLTGKAVDLHDRSKGSVWVVDDISIERAAVEALRQAKELAENAARTKANFLANMSHEIRTPMNAVLGMAHLMLKTELQPRQREFTRKILDAGQHLLGIINDVLDVSKMDAGKLAIERQPFDVEKLLTRVCSLTAEKTVAKGLELIFDVDREVPTQLIGDALRLTQVLVNFVNNAIKFTERGEVSVVVRVREQTAHDALLYFAVRDTGIGLSAAQCSQLFQSFQQADASTTRKFGGTGLGLAIAKSLVTLMQGEVGVDSELGQGSTFWFTARLGRDLQAQPQRLQSPQLQGRRALVVDDNDSARAVMRDMLETLGFVVVEAASGAAAVDAVVQAEGAAAHFDLVYLDWRMPDMDGIETAQALRARAMASRPRLVMVTAYGHDEVLKNSTDTGIEDVLTKPVNPSMLFDSVVKLLGVTSTQGSAVNYQAPVAPPALAGIRGARILLVEDNALNQEVACGLLQEAGCVVDIAHDGAQAVQRVRQHGYDLVLMDMLMPVMDGLTATREIRRWPEYQALPILAMTANVLAQDRERCLQAGMDDHLGKPIEPEVLWQKLVQWIAPRSPLEAPSAPIEPAHTRDSDSDSDWTPTPLPGLDVALGLRRVLGKKSLYLSLLQRFVEGQSVTAAQLRALGPTVDRAALERLVHSTKSVCGSIGALALQQQAERLESELRTGSGSPGPAPLMATLADALDAMVAALRASLPPLTPAEPSVADLSQARELSVPLLARLRDADADALELWADHDSVWQAALGADFRAIDQALKRYDFDAALPLLRAALAQLEQSHGAE